MPKFRPLPPIASAPISRITPESEKNHLDAPMKSKVQPLPSPSAPSAAGWVTSFERPIAPSAAWVASTAVNSETSVADAEREREALDFRGRQREQDERGHERDDVRVDDRREAAFVAGRDPRDHRSAAADLLLDALEDHDVRVRRDADREDQAGDARQRQRDRDQLDQREEVDAVDRPGRRPRSGRGCGRRRRGTGRRRGSRRGSGDQALVERLFAERRRDLRAGDQVEPDRQGARLELFGEFLRGADREAAGDLRAVGRVDPFRVASCSRSTAS